MLEQEGQVRERPVGTPEDARLVHIYPPRTARIGAIAYCGHVKQTPWSGRYWLGRRDGEICIVCAELVDRI